MNGLSVPAHASHAAAGTSWIEPSTLTVIASAPSGISALSLCSHGCQIGTPTSQRHELGAEHRCRARDILGSSKPGKGGMMWTATAINHAQVHFGPFDGRVWLNCAHQAPLPNVARAEAEEAIAWKAAPGR